MTFVNDKLPKVAITTCLRKGFTLIEVVIALAVLAIAMGAIIGAVSNHVNNAAYLRDRTLAHWVAMNKVAEVQLGGEFPKASVKSGTAVMANADWDWSITISETPDNDIRRLDVEVHQGNGETALARLIAYLGRPR